eukprot:gene7815-8661_t
MQAENENSNSTPAENPSNINSEENGTGLKSDDNKELQSPGFMKPERFILKPADIRLWQRSEAYRDFVGFISTLNESIKGMSMQDEYHISSSAVKVSEVIRTLDGWVDEIPPINQPQRFGNKAFRDWLNRVDEQAESLLVPLLEDEYKDAVQELKAYLCDAFGNKTRIDYGTGHEAAFCAFLCCLFKLRVLTDKDQAAIVFKIFHEYVELTRRLQIVYRMEPAGSQGVWGLDDFHFLPFIWGSAQLIDHPMLLPDNLVNATMAEKYSNEYMFLGCIKHINATKHGPFAEHSNTLWGISSIPNWGKVNSGLIKMYKAEVLNKFPVVQHFLFGTLMSSKQL